MQRVFDDAACWCESDVFVPYEAASGAPASLIVERPDREDVIETDDDPRLLSFVIERSASSTGCSLSADAARGELSERKWGPADSLVNACTGVGSLSIRQPLCRAELDHCLGQELALAASSSTRPLPPAVRDAVRNESVRRLQSASVRAVAELARLRSAGVCPSGSTEPDCIRLANGYEPRLYTRVSDAASTALVAAHDLALDARREADVVTPGQVETTSFGAQMFGPTSSRAAMMQELYGATSVTGAPVLVPEVAIDAPAPVFELVPPPPSLLPPAFRADIVRVIAERSDLRLAAPLTLSVGGGMATLPTGTMVDVWLVHYAPTRSLRRGGTITFPDRRVIGVLPSDHELASTHTTLGSPGTTYYFEAGVGVDGDDRFTLGRNTVSPVFVGNATSIDEIRIVTPAFPEPTETVVSAVREGDMPFAGRTYGDVRTARALGLLSRYRIAFPHRACLDAATGEVTNAEWESILRDPSESMFDALELAVGRELVGPSFMRGMTIVTETYGVGQSDVADALDYVRDAESVLDGLVLAPASGCGPSILRVGTLRQRDVRALQAAFARSGTGGLAGSRGVGTGDLEMFYTPTSERMRSVGSVGTAQMLRTHLASGFPTNAESVAAANDTLALIDTEIGSSWTEWRVCDLTGCDSDPMWSGRWSLFERSGAQRPAGVPYLVASAEDARCLVNGREPLAPAGATCAHVTSNPERYVPMGSISVGAPGSCPAGTAVGPYCRRDFIRNDMRNAAVDDRRFVVWCAREIGDPAGTCRTHELVDVIYTGGGPQAHAFGGDIGAEVEEALALDPSDPAYPLFNSLGFPRNFVPPLENELIDDDDSREDSWQTYLASATRAQQEATALLQTARQHELEQLAYDRTVEAQLESAALAQQETVSAICGADTPEAQCNVERIPRVRLGEAAGGVPGLEIFADPGPSEVFSFGGMPYNCTNVHEASDHVTGQTRLAVLSAVVECTRWQIFASLNTFEVHDVPASVVDEVLRTSRSGVAGGEFAGAGGRTRQQLIALYQNFEDLRTFARSLHAAAEQVLIEIEVLAAKYASTENSWFESGIGCWLKSQAMHIVTAGAAVAASIATGGAALPIAGALVSGYFSHEAVADACADGNLERRGLFQQARANASRAVEALTGLTDEGRRLLGKTALADSEFDDMARQVELAQRRREIAERLATSGVQGDPTWRALLGIEQRRATESLENAQRYAFVARRAIETRLALDMASMTSPEPYVDAPAFWVNDVFDLGSAVEYADDGMGTVTAVDVRAEALSDYLHSLASFVDGYAFDRRFSEGDDVQIVNLGEIVPADAFSAGYVDPPFVSKVLFRCNGSSDLLPGGVPVNFIVADPLDPPAPCGVFTTPTGTVDLGGVAGASFAFSIPVDLDRGYFGERFSGGNFNYRTRDLSVNLVGRALFDCERAARPTECYGDGNLQYSMRHEGETVLESWDGDQRLFPFEPGVIQRARALADERWLTNPLSSTDTALITSYTRVEWWGRPLAGTYTLEIESRPEMEWRNLENVQVLIRYHYWTHQR